MIFRRIYLEWKYFTKRPWTLNEVGKFWDQVDDYDDINARLYPYYQRFINSKKIFFNSVKKNFKPKKMLDIQTRTGKGTIFWKKEYPNVQCFIADFSKVFLKKTKINLKKRKINFKDLFVQNLPLPYKSKFFDLIVCYETLEHVYEYEDFVRELTRVANHKCKIIITTPNISWEIIHWITAIVGFNHSEGPHRFLSKKKLDTIFKNNNLKVLNYNTDIFLPFNNKISVNLDKLLMRILPKKIKELVCLRHSYILLRK
jgi:2-polyprenyl-3-methyl-5-hydroxy-6-metoxy-1,4-benzoquinol methylase